MTIARKEEGDKNVYQKEKLVMNINNDPEKIELVDRLNMYVVKTKRYRTKSDAVFALLRMALDQVDRDEREALERTKKAVVINPPGVNN